MVSLEIRLCWLCVTTTCPQTTDPAAPSAPGSPVTSPSLWQSLHRLLPLAPHCMLTILSSWLAHPGRSSKSQASLTSPWPLTSLNPVPLAAAVSPSPGSQAPQPPFPPHGASHPCRSYQPHALPAVSPFSPSLSTRGCLRCPVPRP